MQILSGFQKLEWDMLSGGMVFILILLDGYETRELDPYIQTALSNFYEGEDTVTGTLPTLYTLITGTQQANHTLQQAIHRLITHDYERFTHS